MCKYTACEWTYALERNCYLGIVMHLVLQLCVVIAFSSSSRPADFLSFFTRLLTAFSLHLSSPSAFFQPSSRFTIGGLKLDSIEVIICTRRNSCDPHRAARTNRVIKRASSTSHNTFWYPLTVTTWQVYHYFNRQNDANSLHGQQKLCTSAILFPDLSRFIDRIRYSPPIFDTPRTMFFLYKKKKFLGGNN